MWAMAGGLGLLTKISSSPTWPLGTDGDLLIDGFPSYMMAGTVMDYSSITIINGGSLNIMCDLAYEYNDGSNPTIIGCSGDFTMDAGSCIFLNRNVGARYAANGDSIGVSAPTGAIVSPVNYSYTTSLGGSGGETGGYYSYSAVPGYDILGNGCGGGGAGGGWDGSQPPPGGDGGHSTDDLGWGKSGEGATGSAGGGNSANLDCYGGQPFNGNIGTGGESTPTGIGGGGSGATRGYHGGCLYLQVAGTVTVPASTVVIDASGTNGGIGGDGASVEDYGAIDYASGGGGGGGGAGGSGGTVIIRYKTGSIDATNINVNGGIGGAGGIGGNALGTYGSSAGTSGTSGTDGNLGTTDIATY